MKKSKFILFTVTALSALSLFFSFSIKKKNMIQFFTTTIYNGTATKVSLSATTTAVGKGDYRYYTFAPFIKATRHSYLTLDGNE